MHFDRVLWTVIPDSATAAAAMRNGEAERWEQPIFDLPPLMKTPTLNTTEVEVSGNIGLLRLNQFRSRHADGE